MNVWPFKYYPCNNLNCKCRSKCISGKMWHRPKDFKCNPFKGK